MPDPDRPAEPRPEVATGDPFWGAPLIGLLYLASFLGLLAAVGVLQQVAAWAPGFAGPGQVAVFLALLGLGLGGSVVALRHARPRRGWAELHEDRIVLHKGRGAAEVVRLEDLAGYSLPAADYVQLHLRGEGRPRRRRAIPTPRPEARERVVALLRERGLAEV